jgi:hypothetical protein
MLILNLLWTKDSYNWLNPFMISSTVKINNPKTPLNIHMICCSQSIRSIQTAILLRGYYNRTDPIYILPYINEIGANPDLCSNSYMKMYNLKIVNMPKYVSTFDKHVIPIIKNLLWYNNNIGMELIKSLYEPNYEFNVMIISHNNIIKGRYNMEIPNGQTYIQQLIYNKFANQQADTISNYYNPMLQVPYVSYVNKVY